MRDSAYSLEFVVAGTPRGKARPRSMLRTKSAGEYIGRTLRTTADVAAVVRGAGFIHVHSDDQTDQYEALVCAAAWRAEVERRRVAALSGSIPVLSGPWGLRIEVVHARPKDKRGSDCEIGDRRVKPDLNNVRAAIQDGLQRPGPSGVSLIEDDALIQVDEGVKRYARPGESEGVRVLLWTLRGESERPSPGGQP